MSATAQSADQWIPAVCRQFSDATGWPLRFAPEGSATALRIAPGAWPDAQPCWSAELHDGERRVGYLYLELPADRALDRTFPGLCGMAAMVAHLAGRALVAERELASRAQEVTTLVDIGRTLPTEDNLRHALERLLRAALELTGFRCVAFFLLNPKTQELNLRSSHELNPCAIPHSTRKLKTSPFDVAALAEGKAHVRREALVESPRWLPPDWGTAICLAVKSEAGPLGTLWAYDRRRRAVPTREVHVLESIAAQVSATLERAVLLRESATQQRLRRELKVASEGQIFGVTADFPTELGLEAAAICTSHYEVGGDLCELIPLSPQQLLVAIGDASGDSIPAALVMSTVRGALRSLALASVDDVRQTERVMRRINQALHSVTPSHQFMSLLLGVYDGADRTLRYTNAGHPTPVHLHGEEVATFESHGMLLGVANETTYACSTVTLAQGDLLVMFSDGISEAMGRRRSMFRSDGIVSAVRSCRDGSAQAVLDAILSNLQTHTGGAGAPDDRTLLVLRSIG